MRSLVGRLLLITGLALVPALAFQGWSAIEAHRARAQRMHDDAQGTLNSIVSEQQQVVEGADQLLTALGRLGAVAGGQESSCGPYFAGLLQEYRRYAMIGSVGLDGRLACAADPSHVGDDISKLAYFKRALSQDGLAVGNYVAEGDSSQPTVHLARRYRGSDGRVAGVVSVGLDLAWLQRRLNAASLPAGVSAFILDHDGTVLARRPDPAPYVGRPVSNEVLGALRGSPRELRPIRGPDGTDRLIAYAPVLPQADGFSVVVGLDPGTAFRADLVADRRGLLLLALSIVLALAVAAAVAGPMVRRPMHRLVAAAGRWRAGDFATRTGLAQDRSEFGRLAAAFDAMAEAAETRQRAMRVALESTGEVVFTLSSDWRITFLNQRALRDPPIAELGDLVGHLLWEAFPGIIGTTFFDAFQRCMSERRPAEAEQFYEPHQRYYAARAYPSEDGGITVFFRDLTEERAVAARLSEREEILRAWGEVSPNAIYAKDRAGRFVYANPAMIEMIGRPLDAVVGHTIADLLVDDPATAERVMAIDRRIMERGETETIEDRALDARSGEVRVWQSTKTPLRDKATGETTGLAGIDRDITEQRRAEQALADSEARFRAAVQAVSSIVWTTNAVGDPVGDQPSWTAFTGQGQEGYQGLGWAHAVHPDDMQATIEAWNGAVAQHKPFDFEHRLRRHDGAWRRMAVRAVPILGEDGAVREWVGVHTDVTEQREAEAALFEQKERLRLFVEHAPAAIAMFDREMRYLAVSRRFVDDLGLPPGTMPEWLHGRIHHEVFPEVLERWPGVPERIVAGETVSAGEVEWLARDGHIEWACWEMTPWRRMDGAVGGCLLFVEIVTARRRAEMALAELNRHLEERVREEVAAREAAQERARRVEHLQALGQLAGGVAHEFNNILQAVQGGVGLIESRATDPTSVRRFARIVLNAAERGTNITGRLLTFAQRGEFRPTAIDPMALLDDLRELLAHTLGARITVRVDVAPGLPALLADKGQLMEALANLATNARDAMPNGGTLTLAAEAETVEAGESVPVALEPGRYIRIAVRDTGGGMDVETLSRAVEPFFTTKPLGQGTGLGLPMTKGFAEQSGGGLMIESELGRGTTVMLWLPVADRIADRLVPAAQAVARPARRVLLVDDEQMVRETLGGALEDAGLDVLIAGSGFDALALLDQGEPVDALVADFSMPGMDGLTLIRQARARRRGLPALMLTGFAGAVPGDMHTLPRRSFAVLRKPVSATQVAAALDSLIAAQTVTAD